MPNLGDTLLDDFVGHNVNLQRYSEGVRRKVMGVLMELRRDLIASIEDIDINGVSRSRYRMDRLQTLLDQVDDTLRSRYKEAASQLRQETVDLAEVEGRFMPRAVNRAIQFDLMSASFTKNQLRSIVANTQIEGAPASEWWSRQQRTMRNGFRDQMRMGVLAGETNQQLIQRVRGTATGRRHTYEYNGQRRTYTEFRGGLMDTGTRQASALVRTSVQSVSNRMLRESMDQNSDVLRGLEAVVTLDTRTSFTCIARSGAAWDLETGEPLPDSAVDEPYPGEPPWHFQCRTMVIPVVKSFEQLANENPQLGRRMDERMSRGTQASMNGQVARDTTYEQWLKRQPASRQVEVLGQQRYDLWRKGKISSLIELVDQTGRPLPLNVLDG